MDRFLNREEAAAYCHGLPLKFFNNQLRLGNGPAFVRVSPKRVFFRTPDLDAWMASWKYETPGTASGIWEATD
jgi:hypothetical protein